MKKKVGVIVLLCAILSFGIITASAEGERKSGLFTYDLKGNGNAVITGFDWEANGGNDIYVPRQIDGYNVTEIGAYAFSNAEADFEVPLVEGYTFLNEKAEIEAPSIGAAVVVILPDTITVIGEKAFFCTSITAATIPANVQLIGSGAFAGCRNIKQHSVASGNNVYATIDGILYQKTNKELVSVPAGYPGIGEKPIQIPDGITRIGDYAFAGLDFGKGEGVIIPSTVTSIGQYSFYSTKIQEISLIGAVEVEAYAFSQSYMEKLNGMEYVTRIGDHAFANATINDGWSFDAVEAIGDYAFENACFTFGTEYVNKNYSNLRDLKLPASLQSIGVGSFQGFRSKFMDELLFRSDVYLCCDMSETTLQTIPAYTFYGSRDARIIKLPETLKNIEEFAFSKVRTRENSKELNFSQVDIILPPSVEKIGAHAFELTGVNITFSDGSKLNEIGEYAFNSICLFNESAEIDLPEGVKKIGEKAFNTQYGLDIVNIPPSVTEIGDDVCDRAKTQLKVESGSYAALYASENGYATLSASGEDTSWLNS